MFADSINLMAQAHCHYCFDTTPVVAGESFHQALLHDGAPSWGTSPAVPSGRLPGGPFFFFFLSSFLKDILQP